MVLSTSVPTTGSSRHTWLAVAAVGLATFSVVTTEMLPIGLLTPIADSVGISVGTAGLAISVPALLASLFAPLVVLASGGIDRRHILCGLLALLVIANIGSALAPSFGWMLSARVLVGFCMGGIWAIAGGLAARLVPAHAIGLATSIIFGGVAAASVLGVPLGAFIGDFAGWRWAFGGMALLNLMVLALHLAVIPKLPVASSATLSQFGKQCSNRSVQLGLLLTLLLVGGHFIAFTFVRPLLLSVSGFDAQSISLLLFAYGAAGLIGNFLAGILAVKRTSLTVRVIAFGLCLTPALFLSLGDSHIGGAVVMLIWGLAYGGVSVGLMTWMMKAAPDALEVVTALYVGAFNIAIALGAWAGGTSLDAFGVTGNLWWAGSLAAIAGLLVMRVKLASFPAAIA